jgi:Sugar (and other) transporter
VDRRRDGCGQRPALRSTNSYGRVETTNCAIALGQAQVPWMTLASRVLRAKKERNMPTGVNTAPTETSGLIDFPDEGLRKIGRYGLLIAIGSFLFGYDTGVISGALIFIKDDFSLTSWEQGSVVSVLLLGAVAGALLVGRFADQHGRRRALGVFDDFNPEFAKPR